MLVMIVIVTISLLLILIRNFIGGGHAKSSILYLLHYKLMRQIVF